MADKTKHTKTPWTTESPCGFPYSGIYIVPESSKDFPFHIAQIRELREDEETDANAEFIVTACNAHDALVEALEDSKKEIEFIIKHKREINIDVMPKRIANVIDKALTLARGGQDV